MGAVWLLLFPLNSLFSKHHLSRRLGKSRPQEGPPERSEHCGRPHLPVSLSPCHRHTHPTLTYTHTRTHTHDTPRSLTWANCLTNTPTDMQSHTQTHRHTCRHTHSDTGMHSLTDTHTHTSAHPASHTDIFTGSLLGFGNPPEVEQLHDLLWCIQMHPEVLALPRLDPTIQAGGAADTSHPPQPGLPQGTHCAHLRRDLEQRAKEEAHGCSLWPQAIAKPVPTHTPPTNPLPASLHGSESERLLRCGHH